MVLEEMNIIFSEMTNSVVDFIPTKSLNRSCDRVDACIETDPVTSKKDTSTETNLMKDAFTQTDYNLSISKTSDDIKLNEWLKKILPLMEEELSLGITKTYDMELNESENIKISKHQTISIVESMDNDKDINMQKKWMTNGAVCWLSIYTDIFPILAISCYANHSSWCEHPHPSVLIFGPKSDSNGVKVYTKINEIPVKSCVIQLSTNSFNKDMFSGATISGDLYIWLYDASSNQVEEILCDSYEQGAIAGFAWLKMNTISNDNGMLTCHQDGYVNFWRVGKKIIREKTFKITGREKSDQNTELTAIVALNRSEFVVGTTEGKLYLCSATQLLPIHRQLNLFDPIINELDHHQFAVSSIITEKLKDKMLLITCDLSGEVFIHDIENLTLKETTAIIKTPLPFKNNIICTKNLSYILSCGTNGDLDMFNITTGEATHIDGDLVGRGDNISITENGFLVITGVYEGQFQLYKIDFN